MELAPIKKIVIITESIIEDMVIHVINPLGVKGYTIYRDLPGKGRLEIRNGFGEISKFRLNVRIEILVADAEVALSIMKAINRSFYDKGYAGIVYMDEVLVLNPEKF